MLWYKIASNMKFSSNTDGTEKSWPLALQDWGLRVKDVVYVIFVIDRSSTAAKVGARHDEGPDTQVAYFITWSTPIPVATVSGVPKLVRGATAAGTLMPHFVPTVLVASTGVSTEWVVADVYVGGRPE
jgi:hypothetical protein